MLDENFHGTIDIITGPMFSGKTEELIRQIKRLRYSRTDFLVFKPASDTRYGEFKIVTHDKTSYEAFPVSNAEYILRYCQDNPHVKTIAIDEAQFFPENPKEGPNLLEVWLGLRKKGYRIIVSGLDMNHRGEPFGLMPNLMAIADSILKLKSVCFVCGRDANMSFRLSTTKEEFELGSQDKYQARCYLHWIEGLTEKLKKEKQEEREIKKANQANLDPKEEVSLKDLTEDLEEEESQEN